MKINNQTYILIISLFIGCATITNISVTDAIKKNDVSKLESILSDIKEKNNETYNEIRLQIESYLSEHYLKLGNGDASVGKLNDALLNYKKSQSFKMTYQNKKGYENVIKVKDDLDNLIHYFSSSDTSNYHIWVNRLKTSLNTLSPVNKRKYLKALITKNKINKILNLGDILDNKVINDFEKYLELLGFENQIHYESSLFDKYKLFVNKYRKYLYEQSNYFNFNTRLYFMKFIDLSDNKGHITKLERVEIINNLKNFYKNSFNPDFSKINDLYECYIVNTTIDNLYKIEKPIDEYIELNTYLIKSKKHDNRVSNDIIEILRSERIIDYTTFRNPNKILSVEISIDTIWTDIDNETYKKEIYSKYLIGTHTEANPKYNKNVDNVIYWEHEVARIRTANVACDDLPSETFTDILMKASCYQTVPIDELNTARNKLAKTSTTIEVKDLVPYTFSEIGHSIEGLLKLSINIEYSNKLFKSIPIKSHTYINSKSLIGVSPNDQNNYEEKTQLIPTDIILENILIKNASKKIKDKLNNISLLSTYLSTDLLSKKQILDKVPSWKSTEFLKMFSFTQEVLRDDLLKLFIPKQEHNFKRLKDVIKFARNASCQVISYNNDFSTSSGTGYFISEDGFLITNQHILNNKENIMLLIEIDNVVEIKNAKMLYSDAVKDLALLKTVSPFENSTTIILNNEYKYELGDEIIYVGYPESPITSGSEPFTSRGIISQVVKNENINPTLVLFDLTANPGSSGSAVINEKTGELIGTLTWGFGRSVTVNDIIDLIGGQSIRIKESQNVGTSVNVLFDFLKESGYYVEYQ